MALREVTTVRRLIRPFGTCLSFPGSAGIVTLGTTNPFGSASFYFSAWVKWVGVNGGFQTIFAKRDSYAADGLMFSMSLNDTTGNLSVDTVTSFVTFSYVPPTNVWFHMAWVHDVTGSKDKLYINGELISDQGIGTLGTKTDALISIGGCQSPSIDWFNGKLDEIVIGTGLPTASEIFNLYTKGINPATVWRYLKLDEGSGTTATDSSANGVNGTIADATYATDPVMSTRSTAGTRFLLPTSTQKSLYFDGTAYAAMPITPDHSNGFSFSVWWKPNVTTQDHGIVNWESTFDRNGFSFRQNNGGAIAIVGSNASGTVFILTSSTTVQPNKWYFLTVTYNSSKQVKVYLNASQILSGSGTITSNVNSLRIGSRAFSASMTALGFMKNFTFQNVSTAWTTTQITDLYYRNTIPSGAKQWSMNDVATDQNGENGLTLTNTSYSTTVPFQSRTAV